MNDTNTISSFRGQYACLKNTAYCPIIFNGDRYPSIENALAAARIPDEHAHLRHEIMSMDPYKVKEATAIFPVVKDWRSHEQKVLLGFMRQKFKQGTHVATVLSNTGEAWLVDGMRNNNGYWGCNADGTGLNVIGQLLMHRRRELKEHRLFAWKNIRPFEKRSSVYTSLIHRVSEIRKLWQDPVVGN